MRLLAEQRFRDYEKPLNADSSFWSDLADHARDTLQAAEDDTATIIAMLRDMPRYFDQQIANMRAGAGARLHPAAGDAGRGATSASRRWRRPEAAEASPFYEPFKTMPATIPAATQAQLRARGACAAIARRGAAGVSRAARLPARRVYPGARTALAADDLPDGSAYYQSQIVEYTTLDHDARRRSTRSASPRSRRSTRGCCDVMKAGGLQGRPPRLPDVPAHRSAVLRQDAAGAADRAAWIAKTFDGKAAQLFRLAAARALRDQAGAGRHRALLHRRPRRAGHLPGQHLRPAVARRSTSCRR